MGIALHAVEEDCSTFGNSCIFGIDTDHAGPAWGHNENLQWRIIEHRKNMASGRDKRDKPTSLGRDEIDFDHALTHPPGCLSGR